MSDYCKIVKKCDRIVKIMSRLISDSMSILVWLTSEVTGILVRSKNCEILSSWSNKNKHWATLFGDLHPQTLRVCRCPVGMFELLFELWLQRGAAPWQQQGALRHLSADGDGAVWQVHLYKCINTVVPKLFFGTSDRFNVRQSCQGPDTEVWWINTTNLTQWRRV